MANVPKRVHMIHVPIYETDKIILENLPPRALSTWVRAKLLELLTQAPSTAPTGLIPIEVSERLEALENTYSTEIATLAQEVQALKADTYTKAEIDQVLAALDAWKEEITANVLASVQEWLQEQESEPEPEEEIPAWQKSLSKGIRE